MMLLSKTTNATKNKGRCQTWRERPVRSMIAITNHAARKPATPITKIQGKSRSIHLNSGRFSAPKTIKKQHTNPRLAEIPDSLNDCLRRIRLSQCRGGRSPLSQAIHVEVNDWRGI